MAPTSVLSNMPTTSVSSDHGILTATTIVLLKLSGYIPSGADAGPQVVQYGMTGVASAGLALACAVQLYAWLQWAVFCGADAVSMLHQSAHTLFTLTHRLCPPEEDTSNSSYKLKGISRGEIEFKSVTLMRGCCTIVKDFTMHIGVGDKVLLYGPQDSGKTSIAHALVRALMPKPGGKVIDSPAMCLRILLCVIFWVASLHSSRHLHPRRMERW